MARSRAKNHAQPLAVQDREPFLQEIAARLTALPHLGDGIVHRVVAEVQRKHFDPPIGSDGPKTRSYATNR